MGGFLRDRGPNELTVNEFIHFIGEADLGHWNPKLVVVHHTFQPELSGWKGMRTLDALERFYHGTRGWSKGPHFYVTDKFWYKFTPVSSPGVHAKAFNTHGIGIEVVHNGDRSPFPDKQARTLYQGAAALFKKLGVCPTNGLRFHRDDPKAFKTCPGLKVTKADVLQGILSYLHPEKGLQVDPHPEDGEQHAILWNGKPTALQNKRVDGTTYVPLRAFATLVQARVLYVPSVSYGIQREGHRVDLTGEIEIDNGSAWVSLRPLAESLGMECLWDKGQILLIGG